MNPGFVHNLSFDEYLAVPALSGSTIVNMRRSPLYYKHCWDNPQPETPAQKLGTAAHLAALEPTRLNQIAVWGRGEGENVRRGKVWDAFEEAHAGKMILTASEYDSMYGIARAVHSYAPAHKLLCQPGPIELSMFWTDKVSGRKFKGRIDKVIPRKHTILDLKSTRSATPYKFGGQAYSLGYHIKAYLYCSGYEAITGHKAMFKWLAIESKPPHECAVYRATPDILLQGAEDLDVLLKKLSECESSNEWPPDMTEESDLILPPYAYTSTDDLADFEDD